jgi:uncharacterized membrane protein YesL
MMTMGKLPMTPAAKRVIKYAAEESEKLKRDHIDTEHILLGLLREDMGVAAQILMNLGLRLDDVRAEINRVHSQPQASGQEVEEDRLSASEPLPKKRSIPTHWIVLGLLVVTHAGIGAYFYGQLINIGDRRGPLMVGFLLSQPILLAFWAGFASQPFRQRFLWTLTLCILAALGEELGSFLSMRHSDSGRLMVVFFGLYPIATVLSLIIRRVSRWQIKHSIIENARSDYQPSQFGIKHLIILISITALACGLVRSLVLLGDRLEWPPSMIDFVVGLFTVVCLLLPVLLIPWFVMAHRPKTVQLIITMAIIWVACSSAACAIMAQQLVGRMVFWQFVQVTLPIQLGSALSVLISTLAMRLCGFRMVRLPRAASVKS